MRWIEIAVDTTVMAEEAVSNILMDAGCGGVAVSGSSAFVVKDYPDVGVVPKDEDMAAGRVRVAGYLPLDDSFEGRLSEVRKRIDGLSDLDIDTGQTEITLKPVDEEDWATAWKAYFRPFKVGKVVVKPSWEDYAAAEEDIVVEIDPGMAFGTGTHPTTQLCLLALQKYVKEGDSVLDYGSGSGILSMAAAGLGAAHVIAVDIDPVATEAAQRNVTSAGFENRVEVRQGDTPPDGQFDMVVANIIADTIIRLAENLRNAVKAGGWLISSGIILERENDVRSALESAGLKSVEMLHEGEWTAIVSRRPVDG